LWGELKGRLVTLHMTVTPLHHSQRGLNRKHANAGRKKQKMIQTNMWYTDYQEAYTLKNLS